MCFDDVRNELEQRLKEFSNNPKPWSLAMLPKSQKLFLGKVRFFFGSRDKLSNNILVETAGTFYMVQACMQGNFL